MRGSTGKEFRPEHNINFSTFDFGEGMMKQDLHFSVTVVPHTTTIGKLVLSKLGGLSPISNVNLSAAIF